MFVTVLCIAADCMADPVSYSSARQIAATFLQSKGAVVKDDAITPNGRATSRRAVAEKTPYYVFNATGGQGFVIVSGDDCVGDNLVLGYTDRGSFDAGSVPDNMKWWLEQTASQITELSRSGAKATAVATHADIPYFIKSLWSQGSNKYDPQKPYNAFCPEVDGKLCPAGCMATAMAQVMYYYRWPQGPIVGELPAYETIDGLSVDALPPSSFDWANMVDDYTQPTTKEQQDAVALLMRYCGQMIQTEYTPKGSGAMAYDRDILVNQFGYDQNLYYASSVNYTVSDWDNLLYNELKEGRPIVYTGFSDFAGHQFILDGYAVQDGSGYYHVNWGWAGEDNGYYKLSLLNPSTKQSGRHDFSYDPFTRWQDALIGLKPAENPPSDYGRYLIHYYWTTNFEDMPYLFEALNTSYKPGVFEVAMAELNEDGMPDLRQLYGMQNVEADGYDYAMHQVEGTGIAVINIPEDVTESLTPGSHKMVFVNREAGTNAAWQPIFGTNCCVEFVIGDDGMPKDTLYHPMPQLACQDESFKIEGLFQYSLRLNGSATIINSSDDDYTGDLDCDIYYVDDEQLVFLVEYERLGLIIEGKGTSDIRFNFSIPWAGNYVVILSKGGGDFSGTPLADIKDIYGYIAHKNITIEDLEFFCQELSYDKRLDENNQPAYYLDAITGNNTPLDYDAELRAKIYIPDGEGGFDPLEFCADSLLKVPFQLASNMTETASIRLPRELEAGDYDIDLYISYDFNSTDDGDYFVFANFSLTVPEPTGIKEVQGSRFKGQGDGAPYNLSGQRVTGGYKGIVIKNGKKIRLE